MDSVIIVLDANVLIAFSRRDHEYHERAAGILADPTVEYVVHQLTLAEYLVLPARQGLASDALRWVRDAIGAHTPGDLLSGDDFTVLLANTRAATGLKMPDAIVLATAQSLGGYVATFDAKLRAASSTAGALYDRD